MIMVPHTIKLQSEVKFGKGLPPESLGEIIREVPKAVRRSIRMGFVGRSRRQGRSPAWFEAASDIRFLGLSASEGNILHFEAPTFSEAAPDLYEQQELWPSKPDGDDTGFDLLCDAIYDVAEGNKDSERFDAGLLDEISKFNRGLKGAFHQLEIAGHRYQTSNPAIVNHKIVERAKDFYCSTPKPQQTRIVGTLDMVRASTQSFGLKLDDGQDVRGVLLEGNITDVADLLNKRVLVLGKSIFRPSGRLLRIDADHVQTGEGQPSIWSQMPASTSDRLNVIDLRKPQNSRTGISAVIGSWPGDETDDEIREAFEEIS